MSNKKDCVFYDKGKRKCMALNAVYCETDKKPCKFYKQRATAGAEEKQDAGKL